MEVIAKIAQPLADEHVIGLDPPLRPELPGVWRRRIHPFAGRSVSDKALTAEQDARSGRQRLQGLALSPGTIMGLEILLDRGARGAAPDDSHFHLAPGLGLARSGEDVSVGTGLRIAFGALPVILRADHADALEGEGAPAADAAPPAADDEMDGKPVGMTARLRPALPRRIGQTLSAIAANAESTAIPHVAILLAQPVTATTLGRDVDPCGPDPRDDPYVDLEQVDGCRLALYLWPAEMGAIGGGPDYSLPAADAALRNRLAYRIFDNEKLLIDGEMHPWEEWGVPLALIGFDAGWKLSFLDRAAVVRIGGAPRARTPLVPAAGEPRLWQARIDQFVGQLADLTAFDEATLRATFLRLPPVGVMPPDLFDPVLRRQHFFPGSFAVSAVPIPRSNLEIAMREAAPLASFNRGFPDRVELLVPVPDALYDPELLETAVEDPRFAQAIASFRSDRADWLSRREGARRRYDRLMESVSGIPLGWPASDLPTEEDSPDPGIQVPVEVTRTRRFDEQSAARTHSMTGAHATLPVAACDTIWFWVRIHSAKQMTGLSLRLGTGTQGQPADTFAAGVYWGVPDAMPIAAETAGLAARRIGDLPGEGGWVRLEVPAKAVWNAAGGTLDGFAINAAEFTQRGGQVEWGSFGKTDGGAMTYTYLADDAPAGSVLAVSGQAGPGWPFTTVPGRDSLGIPDFGTVADNGVRRVAALDAFRAQWAQSFLAGALSQVDENGIAAFMRDVDARLKATNDAIDLGFVRARSDIYRVRQIMLGADAASRLVTSPSLADLSLRDEGARATSKGIADFLTLAAQADGNASFFPTANGAPPPPPPPPPPPTSSGGAASAAAGAASGRRLMLLSNTFQPSVMTLNIAAIPSVSARTLNVAALMPAAQAPARATSALTAASFRLPAAVALPASAMSMPLAFMPASLPATSVRPATAQSAISLNVARLNLGSQMFRTSDIQSQLPVAGLVERTISVAERLTPPPAVQALNYAIASKAVIIGTLAGLAGGDPSRPRGIALGDLPMPGFAAKKDGAVPTLDQLIADQARGSADQLFVDADQIPAGKHESDYFTAAVQAIDNSIAIMRLVEGRVSLFSTLQQSLTDLRSAIDASADQAAAFLRSVDVEVEEVRHDIATAERLRAEEDARIAATNMRRGAILASQIGAIGWRRVREAGNRTLVPVLEIASGLAPDPVVACGRAHADVPDEIHDYVELLREAPAKWFPKIAAEVARIDRLEAARAAIERLRERAAQQMTYAAPFFVSAPSKLLAAVQQALVARHRMVDERRVNVSAINLAGLAALSLSQSQVQIQESASLADLIEGRHRLPSLTKLASDAIEGIGAIAGCLHAAFGDVAPATRLGWAEILSEFDQPAPLESLAGLPGWPDVPMDLRRTLQSFVDWLFAQVDRTNGEAEDAINELVRVAMLMAAHAPVDRIIPAQLVAPVPAKPGVRMQLALDVTRIRKGMTTLVRDQSDRVVARGVIEDIVDGHASALITHNLTGVPTIVSTMRFHLVSGTG